MGKIRVSTLGSQEEKEYREKQKVKREEKKKRTGATKVHISGMKGGQRVKSVGAESDEEIDKLVKLAETVEQGTQGIKPEEKKSRKKKIKVRGKKYQEAQLKLDHKKIYPIKEALEMLRKVNFAKFDASVEIHLNVIEKGIRGTAKLPHGTGKEVKIFIADQNSIDKLLADIESGKVNFSVLIAHPSIMSALAKVAKFLGPRGLMPNPKNGTISTEPEKVAEKLKGGTINWKTEADFPIIHQLIGKMSFKDKQLEENFHALIISIGEIKIKSITLKSTMSPGIRVQIS